MFHRSLLDFKEMLITSSRLRTVKETFLLFGEPILNELLNKGQAWSVRMKVVSLSS